MIGAAVLELRPPEAEKAPVQELRVVEAPDVRRRVRPSAGKRTSRDLLKSVEDAVKGHVEEVN